MSKSYIPVMFVQRNSETVCLPRGSIAEQGFRDKQQGTQYRATFTRTRNPAFHRKTFALINACFENQEQYDSFDVFREQMKLAIGFVEFESTTVRSSVLAEYAVHKPECMGDLECTCGLAEALEADTVQTHFKTKSQSFGDCSEDEASELWPHICEWASGIIGADEVNQFDGGM